MIDRSNSSFGVLVLSIVATVLFLPTGAFAETRSTGAGTYYLFRPSSSKPLPAIVFLHGQGADETQGARIFEAYAAKRGYVLICPKGTSPQQSWMLDGGSMVRAVVEEVMAEGGIDKDRVLLVGYSAGGAVAYNYGTNNECFAAVACVNAYMPNGSVSMRNRPPFLLLECEGDPNRPAAEQAAKYLEQADFDVTFKLLPGGSHAYPTAQASPAILDWFEEKLPATEPDDGNDTGSSGGNDPNVENGATSDDVRNTGDDRSTGSSGVDSTNSVDSSTGGKDDQGPDDRENGRDDQGNDNGDANDSDGPVGSGPDSGVPSDSRDGQNTDSPQGDAHAAADAPGTAGSSPAQPPREDPIVNGYGIPVGGLTDSEIASLVKEWLYTEWKPSQSPPGNDGGWTLDDWGVWINGSISHVGGIDGYGSITDFWLANNPACRDFVESRGRKLHPLREQDTPQGQTSAGHGTADGPGPQSEAASRNFSPRPGGGDGGATADPSNTTPYAPASSASSSEDEDQQASAAANDSGTGRRAAGTDYPGTGDGKPSHTSEQVPDLANPSGEGADSSSQVDGRTVDVFVPDNFDSSSQSDWGLVVCLSGIAGNTSYLKTKWREACASRHLVFAGLKALNKSGATFGYRWENDVSDNLSFIEDVVQSLENRYGLSPEKTILVGFSNGAYFIGSYGSRLDDTFEGFVLCEGGSFIDTRDRQIVISGTRPIENSKSGARWSAYCEGMGHKFPGRALPMYQDPGISKTSDGTDIDADAMAAWLLGQ